MHYFVTTKISDLSFCYCFHSRFTTKFGSKSVVQTTISFLVYTLGGEYLIRSIVEHVLSQERPPSKSCDWCIMIVQVSWYIAV